MLLIYGKSGTGKSSVVNCGLMNKIPKEDIFSINIRAGQAPYTNFIKEIKKYSKAELNNSLEILQNIYDDNSKPISLVFDQFEEIFILSQKDKRQKLLDCLHEISNSKLEVKIVIIIREEYLANLSEFETRLPQLFANRIRIEKMHKSNAVHAIEQPCKICNIDIEKGVQEQIIERLTSKSSELELTYFQVLMDRLYKKAKAEATGKITIKNSHIAEIKSIGNVFT